VGGKEKDHQRKLQPVISIMCASGILVLVSRRITSQAQGAKVRVQDTKVKTEGAKVRTSINASQWEAATTFNYNHHKLSLINTQLHHRGF